jgi:hypothetical protein
MIADFIRRTDLGKHSLPASPSSTRGSRQNPLPARQNQRIFVNLKNPDTDVENTSARSGSDKWKTR